MLCSCHRVLYAVTKSEKSFNVMYTVDCLMKKQVAKQKDRHIRKGYIFLLRIRVQWQWGVHFIFI